MKVGRAALGLVLLATTIITGCTHQDLAPQPTPVAVDTPQSAAQQGQVAAAEAEALYQRKSYGPARAKALVALGMLKLDGSDPKAVRTMRLLAAKAGARVKDPASLDELHALAREKVLDAEGRQLAATLEKTLPHKAAPAGPVNPVEVTLPAQAGQPAGETETSNDAAAGQRAHDIIRDHKSWQGQ